MSSFDSRGDPNEGSRTVLAANIPVSCPTCQSASITTTAKIPAVDSYWRCTSCGEIWNASRHHVPRYGGHKWR